MATVTFSVRLAEDPDEVRDLQVGATDDAADVCALAAELFSELKNYPPTALTFTVGGVLEELRRDSRGVLRVVDAATDGSSAGDLAEARGVDIVIGYKPINVFAVMSGACAACCVHSQRADWLWYGTGPTPLFVLARPAPRLQAASARRSSSPPRCP